MSCVMQFDIDFRSSNYRCDLAMSGGMGVRQPIHFLPIRISLRLAGRKMPEGRTGGKRPQFEFVILTATWWVLRDAEEHLRGPARSASSI